MKDQIEKKNGHLAQMWIRPNMVLERRGDCSLILARALRWRKRARKKRRRRKSRFGNYRCMEFMLGTPLLFGTLGFVG